MQCYGFNVLGISQLTGVTRNRRADVSPYLNPDDIDPNLGVIGVNDANGDPLATGSVTLILLFYIIMIVSMELCCPWHMLGARSVVVQWRYNGWCELRP